MFAKQLRCHQPRKPCKFIWCFFEVYLPDEVGQGERSFLLWQLTCSATRLD